MKMVLLFEGDVADAGMREGERKVPAHRKRNDSFRLVAARQHSRTRVASLPQISHNDQRNLRYPRERQALRLCRDCRC